MDRIPLCILEMVVANRIMKDQNTLLEINFPNFLSLLSCVVSFIRRGQKLRLKGTINQILIYLFCGDLKAIVLL